MTLNRVPDRKSLTEEGNTKPKAKRPVPRTIAPGGDLDTSPVPQEKLEEGRALSRLNCRGRSILVLDGPSPLAFHLFGRLFKGTEQLVMSGTSPSSLRARYGLNDARFIWLTSVTGAGDALGLQELSHAILACALRHLRSGGAVLIGDIEYAADQEGLDNVMRFLKGLTDAVSSSDGALVAVADPNAFARRELTALSGIFDATVVGLKKRCPRCAAVRTIILSRSGLVHCTLAGAHGILERVSCKSPTLSISPSRLPEMKNVATRDIHHVWISETGKGALGPGELAFGVLSSVSRHFLGGTGRTLMILGIDQLGVHLEFSKLLKFIKNCADMASMHGGRLFVTAAPGSLEAHHLAVLRKRFDCEFTLSA